MSTRLTTPISESVTQFDIIQFSVNLDTKLFTISVRLTSDDGLTVREREFGADLADLGLLPAAVMVCAKLKAFFLARAVN